MARDFDRHLQTHFISFSMLFYTILQGSALLCILVPVVILAASVNGEINETQFNELKDKVEVRYIIVSLLGILFLNLAMVKETIIEIESNMEMLVSSVGKYPLSKRGETEIVFMYCWVYYALCLYNISRWQLQITFNQSILPLLRWIN